MGHYGHFAPEEAAKLTGAMYHCLCGTCFVAQPSFACHSGYVQGSQCEDVRLPLRYRVGLATLINTIPSHVLCRGCPCLYYSFICCGASVCSHLHRFCAGAGQNVASREHVEDLLQKGSQSPDAEYAHACIEAIYQLHCFSG